jgi:hypothetical protein
MQGWSAEGIRVETAESIDTCGCRICSETFGDHQESIVVRTEYKRPCWAAA